MRHFFAQAGLQKLKKYCCPQTLFAFDYDGTLTPLTSKISEARLPSKTRKLLEKLQDYVPVALVSGRRISDLKKLCSFSPELFIGNHGLEGVKLDKKLKTNFYRICKQWKRVLLKSVFDLQGVELEDKKYSLALHYRRAHHKAKVKCLLLETLSGLYPSPKMVFGKSVINVLPASPLNKGISLKIAMCRLKMKQAIYIGDDKTDEDVFRLPGNSILKIRVGKANTSGADFYLKNYFEINRFLDTTLDMFKKAIR